MKQFFGWLVAGVGAIGTVCSGYKLITVSASAILHPLPINALTGGLAGLALLTIGLIWVRD